MYFSFFISWPKIKHTSFRSKGMMFAESWITDVAITCGISQRQVSTHPPPPSSPISRKEWSVTPGLLHCNELWEKTSVRIKLVWRPLNNRTKADSQLLLYLNGLIREIFFWPYPRLWRDFLQYLHNLTQWMESTDQCFSLQWSPIGVSFPYSEARTTLNSIVNSSTAQESTVNSTVNSTTLYSITNNTSGKYCFIGERVELLSRRWLNAL